MNAILYLVPICIYSLAIIIIATLIWGAINFKNIVKKESKSFKFYIIALGIAVIGLCLGLSDLRMFGFLLLGVFLLLLNFIPLISIPLLIVATIFSIILLIKNRTLLFKIYFWIITVVFLFVGIFFVMYEYENEDFEQNKQAFFEAVELVETLAEQYQTDVIDISTIDYSIDINRDYNEDSFVPAKYHSTLDTLKDIEIDELLLNPNDMFNNDIWFRIDGNNSRYYYSMETTTPRELKKEYDLPDWFNVYDLGDSFFYAVY